MPRRVLLTTDARRDFEDIYDYITASDSPESADRVVAHLSELLESLSAFPERGSYPAELLALGIRDYRQVHFKPYRIIYHVAEDRVTVDLITDGRRDMAALVARRLLGG
jgi:toxin ParE1/3/4